MQKVYAKGGSDAAKGGSVAAKEGGGHEEGGGQEEGGSQDEREPSEAPPVKWVPGLRFGSDAAKGGSTAAKGGSAAAKGGHWKKTILRPVVQPPGMPQVGPH